MNIKLDQVILRKTSKKSKRRRKINQFKMTANQNKSSILFGLRASLVLGVTLLLLSLSLASISDARYLPTRADETDVEVLKGLIKELLAQSNLEQQLEARVNRLQGANPAMNSVGHLIYRRNSGEVPQFSINDNEQRTLSAGNHLN